MKNVIYFLLFFASTCIASEQMPSFLTLQGDKKYTQEELLSAEKKYQIILPGAPNNIDNINHLAAIETSLGKPQEAEQLLRKSLQLKLENPEAWFLFGINALNEQKNDEAFAALLQATLYDPKNARAQQYLGIVAGRKGWSEISEASLRRALELDPNYADAHFNLAVYYLRRTPPAIELARRHYQKALDLGVVHDPNIDAFMKQPVKEKNN